MDQAQEKRLAALLEVSFPTTSGGAERCDGSLRITRQFLAEEGLDVEAELAALAERGGGCCDCEVLLNCFLGLTPEEVEAIRVAEIGAARRRREEESMVLARYRRRRPD